MITCSFFQGNPPPRFQRYTCGCNQLASRRAREKRQYRGKMYLKKFAFKYLYEFDPISGMTLNILCNAI